MTGSPRKGISLEDVRHVARLARLELTDEQLESYRGQLASILEHIDHLAEIDVAGVEPMSHPIDLTNRLDEDVVGPSLPLETLLALAPAVEERYLAVPRVFGEGPEG